MKIRIVKPGQSEATIEVDIDEMQRIWFERGKLDRSFKQSFSEYLKEKLK